MKLWTRIKRWWYAWIVGDLDKVIEINKHQEVKEVIKEELEKGILIECPKCNKIYLKDWDKNKCPHYNK